MADVQRRRDAAEGTGPRAMMRIIPQRVLSSLIVLFLSPAFMLAQDDDHAHHARTVDNRALGRVSFSNSGNAAAQKPFLEGLALIHSFEYTEAVGAFKRAQKAD